VSLALALGSCTVAVSVSLRKLGLANIALKTEQRSAIKAIYEREEVFVCLPTGYGKSDTPMSLEVALVHFNGHLILINTWLDSLASSLKAAVLYGT